MLCEAMKASRQTLAISLSEIRICDLPKFRFLNGQRRVRHGLQPEIAIDMHLAVLY